MSQEIDFGALAEKVMAAITDDGLKKRLKTSKAEYQKLLSTKTKNLQATAAEIGKEERKHEELTDALQSKRNSRGFVAKVRAKSGAMMDDLNDILESIKILHAQISDKIDVFANDCVEMEAKVSQLHDVHADCQATLIVAEDESRLQVELSKEQLQSANTILKRKEDSLVVTEQTLKSKEEKLETARKDGVKEQDVLNKMKIEELRARLSQFTVEKETKEKNITQIKIDIQNETEGLQNAKALEKEFSGNLDKFAELISKENEVDAALTTSKNEKQERLLSLLKEKNAIAIKASYDENMSHAMILRDELKKAEDMQKDLAEKQQKSTEMKEKTDEITSKINEIKSKITGVEENIKEATQAAKAPNDEIQNLTVEMQSLDDAMNSMNAMISDIREKLKQQHGSPLNDLIDIATNAEYAESNSGESIAVTDESFTADISSSMISALSTPGKENKPINSDVNVIKRRRRN